MKNEIKFSVKEKTIDVINVNTGKVTKQLMRIVTIENPTEDSPEN